MRQVAYSPAFHGTRPASARLGRVVNSIRNDQNLEIREFLGTDTFPFDALMEFRTDSVVCKKGDKLALQVTPLPAVCRCETRVSVHGGRAGASVIGYRAYEENRSEIQWIPAKMGSGNPCGLGQTRNAVGRRRMADADIEGHWKQAK